jgi:hypothetical protein
LILRDLGQSLEQNIFRILDSHLRRQILFLRLHSTNLLSKDFCNRNFELFLLCKQRRRRLGARRLASKIAVSVDAGRPTRDALRKGLEDAIAALSRFASYRVSAHYHDDDMGHPRRRFDDHEEWEALEARAAKAADDAREALKVLSFNEAHGIGTPVRVWPGARSGEGVLTKTRSPAMLCGRTAVVWVDGQSAFIALSHVERVVIEHVAEVDSGASSEDA